MTHYDIALIGSGSGNSLPGPEFADRSIVLIDQGVGPDRRFGGTCLNVGCIPTKMLVHTADLAEVPGSSSRFGVDESLQGVRWPDIRDRVFGRIDPISDGGLRYRESSAENDNLTLLRGTAHFTGPKALEVDLLDGGIEEVTADVVVIGAGSRPELPPVEGIADVGAHTSDTVMRIPELPRSMAILGSGVIAAEFAHILTGLGVEVTIIARSGTLLSHEDADIARAFTRITEHRCDVVLDFSTASARRLPASDGGGIELRGTRRMADGERVEHTIRTEALLVATGRRPNSDLLDVHRAGIATDRAGRVRVDSYQRVIGEDGEVLEGVWAFGDISSPHQLKHVANHELRVVRHNLLHPHDLERSDTMPVPHGIFGAPPIAGVGLTEQQARQQAGERGVEVRIAREDYASVAYGWALEDTTGFAKIIMRADTGEILGAHIMGPEATTLIQIIVQAMSTGQTPADIARTQYWIHPAMTELVENALLQLT